MQTRSQPSLQTTQYGIILCTVITAAIHIFLSFQFVDAPDPIFLLNGLGYLLLIAALYAPWPVLVRYRGYSRWLLIGYTALTIILWAVLGARTPIGYFDKLVEIALLLLLWLENQQQR